MPALLGAQCWPACLWGSTLHLHHNLLTRAPPPALARAFTCASSFDHNCLDAQGCAVSVECPGPDSAAGGSSARLAVLVGSLAVGLVVVALVVGAAIRYRVCAPRGAKKKLLEPSPVSASSPGGALLQPAVGTAKGSKGTAVSFGTPVLVSPSIPVHVDLDAASAGSVTLSGPVPRAGLRTGLTGEKGSPRRIGGAPVLRPEALGTPPRAPSSPLVPVPPATPPPPPKPSSPAAAASNASNASFVLQWDDIKLHDAIGFGGQGKVYLGKWKGAVVGVKTLKALRGGEALLAEAAALCSLQHPHVVRVFGYCTVPELAVVMEYVAWGCLSVWIGATKGRSDADTTRRRVGIARGIVSGMRFIHENGYIHCDLKPGNVLLAFDGELQIPKVRTCELCSCTVYRWCPAVSAAQRTPSSLVLQPLPSPHTDVVAGAAVVSSPLTLLARVVGCSSSCRLLRGVCLAGV